MKPDVPLINRQPTSCIKRVALINSIIARNDAVSASVRDTYYMLTSDPAFRVALFAHRNDFTDLPCRLVKDTAELLLHPDYLDADLIIWHAGSYYELFNGALVGNGKARQIIRYHNTTPKQYLPESFWPNIERALHQRHHLRYVDEIWNDSAVNAEVGAMFGVATDRNRVIPFPVDTPALSTLAEKAHSPIDIVFIGRFVRSKGVIELVEALARLPLGHVPFRLTLAGNMEYSDSSYVDDLRRKITTCGLSENVVWLGTVDDATREELYRRAHILAIPSYHEGFCKPVIEGFRAGCLPIGYASYNLPYVANKLGRMVQTGDIQALTDAFAAILQSLAAALTEPQKACLPLDRGMISIVEFDLASRNYVRRFTRAQVGSEMLSRVYNLLNMGDGVRHNIRSNFLVVPDDEMREYTRLSLNRIPDITDWEPGTPLSGRMAEMGEPVGIHRKSWEYAICVEGLHRFGLVKPDTHAIAIGAGSERPLYYFANCIERMVATDLYDNPKHEGTPEMLKNPKSLAPFPYREDHLEVLRMPGDHLKFADETFDFAFCISSIEHFGSRDKQRRSLEEMIRVVRPGGLLCIITELILTDHSHDQYFRWEEIEQIFLSHQHLTLVGGEPDLTISESLIKFPVDMNRSQHPRKSPHIVLKEADMLWTSFSMFLERKS